MTFSLRLCSTVAVTLLSLSLTACETLEDGSTANPSGEPSDSIAPSDAAPAGFGCQPNCEAKTCGDDGCGGSCGTCDEGFECTAFACSEQGADVPEDESPSTPPADGGGDEPPSEEGPDPNSDLDNDGVVHSADNCPTVPNPSQDDMDGDYEGDVCDADIDGDGYLNNLDCVPTNKLISPGQDERCGNGIDDNCDDAIDDENAVGCVDHFIDGDGDGAGEPSTGRCLCAPEGEHLVKVSGDCDDTSIAFSPMLAETCDDEDNNCNLLVDEGCDDDGDDYCDWDMEMAASGVIPAVCPKGGGDCYDYSALINPEAEEVEGDGLDNDCDGQKPGDAGAPLVPNCVGECVGSTPEAALCALDICYPSFVTGQSFFSPSGADISNSVMAMEHYGNTSNDLAAFAPPSYLVMGSGNVNTTSHQDTLSGGTFAGAPDPYSSDGFEIHDAVEFTVNMVAPPGVTGFSVDYIFMSAEYEEWIGTDFNDKFYIILNASETTGGVNKVVNYTQCSNPNVYYDFQDATGKWCYIAINTAFSEPCANPVTNIAGTGHECASGGSSTGWLTTLQSVQAGETLSLTFHIHDTSDHVYDSTVVIDNFQWIGGAFEEGTVTHK